MGQTLGSPARIGNQFPGRLEQVDREPLQWIANPSTAFAQSEHDLGGADVDEG
jgi:hypothetical protein